MFPRACGGDIKKMSFRRHDFFDHRLVSRLEKAILPGNDILVACDDCHGTILGPLRIVHDANFRSFVEASQRSEDVPGGLGTGKLVLAANQERNLPLRERLLSQAGKPAGDSLDLHICIREFSDFRRWAVEKRHDACTSIRRRSAQR